MTYEESKQRLLDLHNKYKLLGADSKLIHVCVYGWISEHRDAQILVSKQNNEITVYIPDGLKRDKDSKSFFSIFAWEHIIIDKLDTIKVIGKCPKDATNLLESLKINEIDLTEFDMSETTILTKIFYRTEAKNIIMTNMKNVEVTDVNQMFYASKIININNFELNTKKVKSFYQMFSRARIGESLAAIKLDTTNAKDYAEMYQGAEIRATLDIRDFKITKYMAKDMFYLILIGNNGEIIMTLDFYIFYKFPELGNNRDVLLKFDNDNSTVTIYSK